MEIVGVQMRVTRETREALRRASDELHIPQREIVAEALQDWLDSMGYLESGDLWKS